MGQIDKLKAQARTLFESGQPVPAIAESLRKSPSTIYRWRDQAAEAGDPWGREAQMDVVNLRDVIGKLTARLRTHANDEDMDTAAWADALVKLLAGLSKTIELFGDSLQKLIVVEELLRRAQDELDEDDFPTVTAFLNGYMASVEEACR